jgi:hypothetical protein
MEQITFNEIIERISAKLSESDDDKITSIYNQLFEIPMTYIGDDLWEEEIEDREDVAEEDVEADEDDEDLIPRKKNSKYDQYDNDNAEDDEY